MKRVTILFSAMTLVAALNLNAADENQKERKAVRERADRPETKAENKQDVEQRIRQINRLDNKPVVLDAGLRAVSKELGTPVPVLEAQLKEHSRLGIAGLLVANTIASDSKKSPETVIKAHGDGRSWVEMARNNNVSLDTLEAKLTRVENAMKEAK
ncbi:MAG TPA: hypothetical protein VK530_17280 [Candidatus Acidoferrum sp.]|nr:hypothetical protein [Candidatus Acidoferrum sp.]